MTDKTGLRSRLFRHLDGIATAHVAMTLRNRGVLDFLLSQGKTTLDELTERFEANDGYLNVAMRTLASQGWLEFATDDHSDEVRYSVNERTAAVVDLVAAFEPVISFSHRAEQYQPDTLHPELIGELGILLDRLAAGWFPVLADSAAERSLQDQIRIHVEGCLIGPILVRLAMDGVLHDAASEQVLHPEDAPAYATSLGKVLSFLADIGWAVEREDAYTLTEVGEFFARRASAYGVIVSYLPMFRKLDAMIFGDPATLRHIAPGEDEQHVDRETNIWGSGGAHANYFRVVDDIIVELFNRPIAEQPRGILDMGCGNGAFLAHLFRLINKQTLRGEMLAEHPLRLIGADYYRAALDVTRRNLAEWGVPADVIWGDIGQPDQLACDLKDEFDLDLKDMLNVRTFLDHNRIWEPPPPKHYRRSSTSHGTFAYRGERINNSALEVNLYHHLKDWAPYVQKFGLLIIELHSVPPALVAANLGATAATAYDAAHGFSDQYIVEIDVLHRIAADAGLVSDTGHFRRFPDSELATISISLFHGTESGLSLSGTGSEELIHKSDLEEQTT